MQNVVNEKNSVKKLKKIDKLIGNLSVSGSGVEITIDTSKTSDITAITLLQLINDLNSAGAEAISIMITELLIWQTLWTLTRNIS